MSSLPTPNDYAELRALMDSPLVNEILHTNTPPEEINRTILATALAKHRAHLESLSETIVDLKARLATMTAGSAQFSSGVHTLETILHPIRALPCEVIGRICEHALEDFAIYPFDNPHSSIIADSLSMRHPSWIFSHVCRTWREAVQRHSRCWSHVVLTFSGTVRNSLNLSLLLSAVLKYAGEAGLSMRIDSPQGIPSNFLTVILPSCYFWREAALFLTLWDYKSLSEMRHAFWALKTLSASISDVGFPGTEIIDVFAEAPHLRTFVMTKTLYSVFQLPRVQHFVYRGTSALSATRARVILISAPALTSASIVLERVDTAFHPIPAIPDVKPSHLMITLSLLDTAQNANGYDSGLASFLKSMLCPLLSELELDMKSPLPLGGSFGGGAIGPSLRRLIVRLQDESLSGQLCNLFRCSVSLEHLVLHVRHWFNLEWFIHKVQDTLTALPIETLTFSSDASIGLIDIDDCSHFTNLCSALRKKGALKMVSINPVTYIPPRTIAELKMLEDDGLIVKMKYLQK